LDTYNDLIIDLKKPKLKKDEKDNADIEFVFSKARHLSHEETKTIRYNLSISEKGFVYKITN